MIIAQVHTPRYHGYLPYDAVRYRILVKFDSTTIAARLRWCVNPAQLHLKRLIYYK